MLPEYLRGGIIVASKVAGRLYPWHQCFAMVGLRKAHHCVYLEDGVPEGPEHLCLGLNVCRQPEVSNQVEGTYLKDNDIKAGLRNLLCYHL